MCSSAAANLYWIKMCLFTRVHSAEVCMLWLKNKKNNSWSLLKEIVYPKMKSLSFTINLNNSHNNYFLLNTQKKKTFWRMFISKQSMEAIDFYSIISLPWKSMFNNLPIFFRIFSFVFAIWNKHMFWTISNWWVNEIYLIN